MSTLLSVIDLSTEHGRGLARRRRGLMAVCLTAAAAEIGGVAMSVMHYQCGHGSELGGLLFGMFVLLIMSTCSGALLLAFFRLPRGTWTLTSESVVYRSLKSEMCELLWRNIERVGWRQDELWLLGKGCFIRIPVFLFRERSQEIDNLLKVQLGERLGYTGRGVAQSGGFWRYALTIFGIYALFEISFQVPLAFKGVGPSRILVDCMYHFLVIAAFPVIVFGMHSLLERRKGTRKGDRYRGADKGVGPA